MQTRIVLPYCRLRGGLWWEPISMARSTQLGNVRSHAPGGGEGRGHDSLEKNGVAGIVRTPARKSRDHPLPPVAEAE